MAFRQVDAAPALLFGDPESIYTHLKHELPGYAEAYYRDLQERIVTIAMERGQNISTVVESFVTGARLRADCPSCLGSGYAADTNEAGTLWVTCEPCNGTGRVALARAERSIKDA